MKWRSIVSSRIDELERHSNESPYRELLSLAWLIGEVENGGLIQYLDNSTGDQFYTARDAALEVGCAEVSTIMDEIAMLFPSGVVPLDRAARMGTTESLTDCAGGNDPFAQHTERFWKVQSALEQKIDEWVDRYGIS
jgi:hypothetical protein